MKQQDTAQRSVSSD